MNKTNKPHKSGRTERYFVEQIHKESMLHPEMVKIVVSSLVAKIKEALMRGESVTLGGFVTLSVCENKYRNIGIEGGMHPEAVKHQYRPKAKFAQAFKVAINKALTPTLSPLGRGECHAE